LTFSNPSRLSKIREEGSASPLIKRGIAAGSLRGRSPSIGTNVGSSKADGIAKSVQGVAQFKKPGSVTPGMGRRSLSFSNTSTLNKIKEEQRATPFIKGLFGDGGLRVKSQAIAVTPSGPMKAVENVAAKGSVIQREKFATASKSSRTTPSKSGVASQADTKKNTTAPSPVIKSVPTTVRPPRAQSFKSPVPVPPYSGTPVLPPAARRKSLLVTPSKSSTSSVSSDSSTPVRKPFMGTLGRTPRYKCEIPATKQIHSTN